MSPDVAYGESYDLFQVPQGVDEESPALVE